MCDGDNHAAIDNTQLVVISANAVFGAEITGDFFAKILRSIIQQLNYFSNPCYCRGVFTGSTLNLSIMDLDLLREGGLR